MLLQYFFDIITPNNVIFSSQSFSPYLESINFLKISPLHLLASQQKIFWKYNFHSFSQLKNSSFYTNETKTSLNLSSFKRVLEKAQIPGASCASQIWISWLKLVILSADKCAKALYRLKVGQNRDFCQILAVFLHPRNRHNAKKAWKTKLWEFFPPSLSPPKMMNLHWSFRWGYGEDF